MKNCGFSLIELVVIIAIMGTLLAIGHLNFSEMQKKENAKSDINKIIALLRGAQVNVQTQSRTGIIILGDNKLVANLYTTTALSTPPVISLSGAGTPAIPSKESFPVSSTEAPPLITETLNLKNKTQDYTTFYIDRRGLFYSIDPDTDEPTYNPITLNFSGLSIQIYGNQIIGGN